MEGEESLFWHRPSVSPAHPEPSQGRLEVPGELLDLLKENWKVIGTGLGVLSLATVGLYALFKTRADAKNDDQIYLAEKQIREKVLRAQTLKSRQIDWLARDRELWNKLETEPVEGTIDSVYDYLDAKLDFDLAAIDEEILTSEVPPLGLKDIYMTPTKASHPYSPQKQKGQGSPSRVRVRDVLIDLESKTALLREAEATIDRQAVVIKRANENFEELNERYKTEQRFRVEAEQHARLMEDQLERLQILLSEQQQLRESLESELKAAQTRIELLKNGDGGENESLKIFEELRAQQVQAQEEIARLKQAYSRVTSEKMQEKSLREVHLRQITQLVTEIDELKAKLQLRNPSPYVPRTYYEPSHQDSYFSPLQSGHPKSMAPIFLPPLRH